MALEPAIVARLAAHAPLVAFVADRVYPLRLPATAVDGTPPVLPAVTYRVVTETRYSAMGADRPEVGSRVQFDVWARRFNDPAGGARQVTEALLDAVVRWSGTYAGTVVLDSYFVNRTDLPPDEGTTHRIAVDVLVYHEE